MFHLDNGRERWRQIGSVRIAGDYTIALFKGEDGRIELIIGPTCDETRSQTIGYGLTPKELQEVRRWQEYARYLWQRDRGPIPPKMLVIHTDGNTLHDDPSNLALVDRGDNMRRLPGIRPQVRARALAASLKTRAGNSAARRIRPVLAAWQCVACGESFGEAPDRCPKCGSAAFEPIHLRKDD